MPEVHGLLPHDVHAHPLLLRFAQHVVLARDVPQDGIGLRDLHVSVDVVGEVGEVQLKRVLDAVPAGLVIVGGGAAAHHLVLILGVGVLQQEPNRLGEL